MTKWPDTFPEEGLGEQAAQALVSEAAETCSARLGTKDAFAHMDPPTPEIATVRRVSMRA